MSLLIGTNIRATLLSSSIITSLVGERVFPLAYLYSQGETVRYPFFIYDGLNIQGARTKDGDIVETTSISVTAAAKTYDEAVDLANKARHVLTYFTPVNTEDVTIQGISATGSSAYYDDTNEFAVVTVSYDVDSVETVTYSEQ